MEFARALKLILRCCHDSLIQITGMTESFANGLVVNTNNLKEARAVIQAGDTAETLVQDAALHFALMRELGRHLNTMITEHPEYATQPMKELVYLAQRQAGRVYSHSLSAIYEVGGVKFKE